MSLQNYFKTQMIEAMKARDATKLSVLRGLLSSFTNENVSKIWAKYLPTDKSVVANESITSRTLGLGQNITVNYTLNIPFKEDENTKIEGSAKAKYSIEYLKKLCAAKCLSDDVFLEFGTDYPLRLTYRQVDKLSLSWILTPRVEND